MPAIKTHPACTVRACRNVITSIAGFKNRTVTYKNISPKIVNREDQGRNVEEEDTGRTVHQDVAEVDRGRNLILIQSGQTSTDTVWTDLY